MPLRIFFLFIIVCLFSWPSLPDTVRVCSPAPHPHHGASLTDSIINLCSADSEVKLRRHTHTKNQTVTFAEAAAVFVLHPTGSARIQTNQSGLCGRSTAAQRRQAQILPNWIYKTFFKASGPRGVYFWGGAKDEKINSTQLLQRKNNLFIPNGPAARPDRFSC